MTEKFEKALTDVRKAMKIMRNFCSGYCTIFKHEGPRHYTQQAPMIPNTRVCTICGKQRYSGEYDNE